MTNTKSTKRALLASVMALLLCFSMLLSTTFAWFTDSVTSGNNIIKSGNLDIELEYAVFNDDGTFKEWKDVKDASDILTNTLWEPGVTIPQSCKRRISRFEVSAWNQHSQ